MKSIFTKLSTLLLCGAVALVGCTDYSEDIQAVDKNVNDLKTEFEGYKTSTAATIAELQSAIDALEAAQEQMAAEYAKKSELNDAVTELQNLVKAKADELQAALTDAAGKIAALEAGKADKTEVAALQEQVTKAIEDANAAIKALEAAKADKAELELVKADVASLIEGYTQTIAVLQNLSTALTATQEDLDVVEADVESLKTAAAEAVYAITNLQASIDAISARVESLEKDLAAAKQQIAQHTEALTNLAGRLEAVEGAVEDEAALRAEADEALQQAVMLLNDGLTNLSFSYNAYVEEMEAYKENLAEEMDELRAQDSALANSILSYYNESIAAVDSAIATLREEQAAAIADLKAEILAAWEDERALIYNTIYNIQTTLETAIAEGDAALQEQLDQAVADIYKTILSYVADLQVEIAEGDANIQANLDDAVALIYKTIESYAEQLRIEMSEIAAVLQKNIDDLTATVTKNYNELNAKIDEVEAALVESVNAVINRVEVLEGKVATLEQQAANMAAAIEDINETIEVLQDMDAALAEQIANVDADAKKALKAARKELQDQIDALVEAKEDLQVRVAVLEELVASNAADIQNNTKEIEANIKAISNLAKQLGTLEATVNALMQSNAAVASALQAKDLELQNNIDAVVSDLAAAIARIGAVEDAVKALQELAATLASKEELAKLEQKMNQIQDMLLTLMVAAEDRANDKIQQLRNLVAEANEAIAALRDDVNTLFARVQSLTYIPDFDDHKAPINYAILTNNKVKTYVSRQSLLRYRVHGQDAEAIAKQIAETWQTNPEILKFDFETVETRSTEAAKASLQIAKVVANDADLYVYAVAKNFEPKFFDPQLNIYSASLVLTHENNIIASEYTNLRAGNEQEIVAVVLDAKGNDITGRKADDETAPVELLPYDGEDPTSVKVLEGHRLGFVIDGNTSAYPTIDEMIAAGYDLSLERRVFAKQQVNDSDWNTSDHSSNEGKPGAIREVGPFQLEEVPFTNHNVEGNTKVWLKQPLKKDDYKALKAKNYNVLYVAFNYFVNGQKVTTEASVVMSNRLVNVNLGAVEVPWTLYGADTLYTTAGAYTKTFKHVGFPYDLTDPKTVNKSLEGYDLYDILQSPLEPGQKLTKTYGSAGYDIQMSIHDETVDFAISGYNFAKATDTDGWNDHTVKWVRDFDDITVTVMAALKFGKVTDTFTSEEKGLVFKLNGLAGSVYAKSTAIVANMFNKYRAVIGIADDAKAKKFFTDVLGRSVVTADKINKYDLQDWQLTAPIATFEPFGIWMHNSQFNPEGAQTVAVAQKDANTLVNFQFAFEGGIDLPVDGLAYSTVDYVNYNTELKRYEVEVDGDIVSNKYTIDQADLGKYFYVVNEADYGVARTSTVKFEILTKDAPKPATDVVGVAYDEASQLNVLNVGQAVIKDWTNAGAFPGNEIDVKATLYVDGFPIDTKNVTLYTVDPLTFVNTIDNPETEEVETWDITRTPGADAIAYTHKVLSLTSVAEEGNLIKTDSTPAKIWNDSNANIKYGAQFVGQYEKYKDYWCNLIEVYTVAADGSHVAYPSNKYLFNNGKVTLLADDGLLNQPIFAKVTYTLTHNFHIGDPTTVTVLVKFVPDNTL